MVLLYSTLLELTPVGVTPFVVNAYSDIPTTVFPFIFSGIITSVPPSILYPNPIYGSIISFISTFIT